MERAILSTNLGSQLRYAGEVILQNIDIYRMRLRRQRPHHLRRLRGHQHPRQRYLHPIHLRHRKRLDHANRPNHLHRHRQQRSQPPHHYSGHDNPDSGKFKNGPYPPGSKAPKDSASHRCPMMPQARSSGAPHLQTVQFPPF